MEQNIDFESERKQLTRKAWSVTIAYGIVLAVLACLALFGEAGVDAFLDMKPNEVGDLLAGIAGPLAFIWLVYGYFLQGIAIRQQAKELAQNTRALHLQEEALRAQVEELKNSVAHQHEIALAANAQTRAMLDAARPALSIRRIGWEATTLVLNIYNAGGPATNLLITGHFGAGKESKRSVLFLPKEGNVDVVFEELLRPKLYKALGQVDVTYFLTLGFEYGNGFSGQEIFVFVEDDTTPLGRFVNRKSIELPKDTA